MGRTRWRLLAAAGALLLLTGCVPEDEPAPTPTESTPEPTYTDDELLEQAMETFAGLEQAIIELRQSNSDDYTALTDFATPEIATEFVANETELSEQGFEVQGAPHTVDIVISPTSSNGQQSLSVVVCSDVSSVQVFDESGANVTDPARATQQVVQVELDRASPQDQFVITSQSPLDSTEEAPCQFP